MAFSRTPFDLVAAARDFIPAKGAPKPIVVLAIAERRLASWVETLLADRYEVVRVASPSHAPVACRHPATAALLVSLGSGTADPLRLAHLLHTDRASAHVRMIVTARSPPVNTLAILLGAGIDEVIFQPFSPSELCERVAVVVDRGRRASAEQAAPSASDPARTALRRLAWQNAKLHQSAVEAAAAKDEALAVLKSFLMSAPVGFCMLDHAERVVHANPRFTDLIGTPPPRVDHVDPIVLGERAAPPRGPEGERLDDSVPPSVLHLLRDEMHAALSFAREPARENIIALDRGHGEHRTLMTRVYAVGTSRFESAVGIIVVDVTERVQAENALRQSNERIGALLKLKNRFLAVVSHELRTPLAAIELWAHAIARPGTPPAKLAQGLAAIRAGIRDQQRLLEDLVDLSRATSGSLRLTREEVRLADILGDVIHAARPFLEAKRIRVARRKLGALGVLHADPRRLAQVFQNVLGNAIRFTPDGGTIRIEGGVTAGRASVTIVDEGPGIAEEFRPHAFEPFQTESESRGGGLGLGLAIAYEITTLHGGTITIGNVAPSSASRKTGASPNTGAQVRVELPRRRPGKA